MKINLSEDLKKIILDFIGEKDITTRELAEQLVLPTFIIKYFCEELEKNSKIKGKKCKGTRSWKKINIEVNQDAVDIRHEK